MSKRTYTEPGAKDTHMKANQSNIQEKGKKQSQN